MHLMPVYLAYSITIPYQPYGIPYHTLSGLVDNGSVGSRNYARADTNLAYIHGAKEPTTTTKMNKGRHGVPASQGQGEAWRTSVA